LFMLLYISSWPYTIYISYAYDMI